MSDIAQALAKAKQRAGASATPFQTPGVPVSAPVPRNPASEAALRKAKVRQRFWWLLSLIALPLTGFVIWMQINAAQAENLIAAQARAELPATTAGEPSLASFPSTTDPLLDAQRSLQVAELSISAVMPGDPARIVVAGRIIREGELVDGGFTFIGISEGVLRFSDATGAVYSRRL